MHITSRLRANSAAYPQILDNHTSFPSLRNLFENATVEKSLTHTRMEENKHRIPNQLVLVRKRKNLSQKRVAHLIGLRDATALSRYESGRALPPLKTALRLAALYDATLSEMFPELSRRSRRQVLGHEEKLIMRKRGRPRKNSGGNA